MKTPRQHLLAMVEQFVRYIGFGSGATLVHYATLFGLVHTNVPVWRASVISNAIGAGLYYVISRRAVFQTARGHVNAMIRFALVAVMAVGCNAAIMAVALRVGLYYLVAQMCASALSATLAFLAHRYWTFRDGVALSTTLPSSPISALSDPLALPFTANCRLPGRLIARVPAASPSAVRTLRETAARLALKAVRGESLPNVVNGVV